MLHPKDGSPIKQDIADGSPPKAAKPATTQMPTASSFLRAPSITPDKANDSVATTSMAT
jgi:hypothetical protein